MESLGLETFIIVENVSQLKSAMIEKPAKILICNESLAKHIRAIKATTSVSLAAVSGAVGLAAICPQPSQLSPLGCVGVSTGIASALMSAFVAIGSSSLIYAIIHHFDAKIGIKQRVHLDKTLNCYLELMPKKITRK